MDTILEANSAVEVVRQAYDGSDQPRPEWVRGECPKCGSLLVSNCYYVGGHSYIICHECWAGLGPSPSPTCDFRKVL